MFLPEHREQLLDLRRRRREFHMPELDEEWLADINRRLADSLEHAIPITVIYGSTYDTKQFTGIVGQIDPYNGWVRLISSSNEDEPEHSGGGSPTNGDPCGDPCGDPSSDICTEPGVSRSGSESQQQVRIALRRIVEIREA